MFSDRPFQEKNNFFKLPPNAETKILLKALREQRYDDAMVMIDTNTPFSLESFMEESLLHAAFAIVYGYCKLSFGDFGFLKTHLANDSRHQEHLIDAIVHLADKPSLQTVTGTERFLEFLRLTGIEADGRVNPDASFYNTFRRKIHPLFQSLQQQWIHPKLFALHGKMQFRLQMQSRRLSS